MKENAQLKKCPVTSIIGIILLVAALCIQFIPNNKTTASPSLSDYSSVNAICELATLKSFYHNVAIYEVQPETSNNFLDDVILLPLKNLVNAGYKKLWVEYSGIVEIGIDASQIQIANADQNGIVNAFIPDAKVLNVYADEKTVSKPVTETGMFTTINGEDLSKAFALAQSAMRQEVENDQTLLLKAKNNAKLLMEQYIINTGKKIGVEYTVNWMEHPI